MADVQTGFASVNGAQLYYEMAGSGTPLVMVHAGICDSRMWDNQFQFFASKYRVVRFDMRGYGKSAAVAGEFYLHQDLNGLLDFLKIERAIVMGCSKGGRAVVDFALDYPQKAAAIITVGSSPSGFEFPDAQPPRQWDEVVACFESSNLERCAELEVQIWVDGPNRMPAHVSAAVRDKVREMDLIALRNEKLELAKEMPTDPPAMVRLHSIRVPLLVIVGNEDAPPVLAGSDALKDGVKGAKLVVMRDTAHVPNMEKPDEFNQLVLEFLEKL